MITFDINPHFVRNDIAITRKLVEVGASLDIVVADHVIIGHDLKYVSLCERGLMR